MKIDLPDEAGNVISMEVKRATFDSRRFNKTCPHRSVFIDTAASEIECQACGIKMNPVEYLANLVDEWHRVQYMYEKYNAAIELLKDKQKCRCQHCGKFTEVKPNRKIQSIKKCEDFYDN